MKNHITIAKPDKSRSCLYCRNGVISGDRRKPFFMLCLISQEWLAPESAIHCPNFRDSRQTSQVISASGKVGPA